MNKNQVEDEIKVVAQSKRWQGVLTSAFETLNSSRDPSPVELAKDVVLPTFKIISPRVIHTKNDNSLLVYTSLTDDKSNILNAIPLQARRKSNKIERYRQSELNFA